MTRESHGDGGRLAVWRGGRAAWALLIGVAAAGCASADVAGAPSPPRVRFVNTTHVCARPVAVEVGARSEGRGVVVSPGASVLLGRAAAGEALGVWSATAGREELPCEGDAGGAASGLARYCGCAAPEHLEAGGGRAPIEIVHHVHGCSPGRRVSVSVRSRGRLVARLGPGERATRYLEVGAVALDVAFDPAVGGSNGPACGGGTLVLEVSAEGARLDLGWTRAAGRVGGLAPVTVLGPDAACPAEVARSVRVAGVEVHLGVGEAYTLFAPHGPHRIEVSDDGGPARPRLIELGPEGVEVEARACTEAGAGP